MRSLLLAGLCLCGAWAEEISPASVSISWQTNGPRHAVILSGLPGSALSKLRGIGNGGWSRVFPVQVEQATIIDSLSVPSIHGKYDVVSEGVEFRPQFPFQGGVKYRASFHPAQINEPGKVVTSALFIPPRKREPSTVVSEIYPTADLLPENLLKFYVHFSGPMSGGHIYEHIRLEEQGGRTVELPFLEIDEELWNDEMTRLTLFLDPGRIKRGVRPLEEVGPALESGKSYVLTIETGWHDAAGIPLKKGYRKTFRVGPVDRESPDHTKWELTVPRARTIEPIQVRFPDPMDQALALRMISVVQAGNLISGRKELRENERLWLLHPSEPWKPGGYRLAVQSTIEDLAGNNIGKPFEVDLFSSVDRRIKLEVVEREFEVK